MRGKIAEETRLTGGGERRRRTRQQLSEDEIADTKLQPTQEPSLGGDASVQGGVAPCESDVERKSSPKRRAASRDENVEDPSSTTTKRGEQIGKALALHVGRKKVVGGLPA
jgi:hypothetical protein